MSGHAGAMENSITWVSDRDDASPINSRQISMRCYEDGESVEVVGRLTDTRHWASILGPEGVIHDMELRLKVELATFTVTAVKAAMYAHPHEECSDIVGAFQQLVGISVMRGYTKKVQELLGRERGCSHLEFMARAVGPVVIQAATSVATRNRLETDPGGEHTPGPWMKNTCHIWAEDGPAPVKLSLGWRPGTVYPVPRVETIRAQLESHDG